MFTSYRSVLACLDTSHRAAAVLAAAVDLAPKIGAKLILFRAVGVPQEIPEAAVGHTPDELADILIAEARHDLERLATQCPAGLLQKLSVKLGVPWQAICSEARDEAVDLIVIGSHGFSGLDRLLGTTAARIVNHADRSVLVARAVPRDSDSRRRRASSAYLA